MISPDGQIGDIPQEHAAEAVKSGFKLGQEMLSPEGKSGLIPYDRVHDALAGGFKLNGGLLEQAEGEAQKQIGQQASGMMAGGGLQEVGEEATGAVPLLKSIYQKLKGMFGEAEGAAPAAESAAPEAAAAEPEVNAENGADQIPQDEWDEGHQNPHDPDTRTREEKQKSVDDYYEAHPEKKPVQKIVKRGPNKGQPATYRVFDGKQWKTVPKMTVPK
jgi:hypothetical protein